MIEIERILQEIVRHVKWTGEKVISNDNPVSRQIGWKVGNKYWNINLTSIRSGNAYNAKKAKTLLNALATQTGRAALNASIPGQRKENEPPTFRCARCNGQTWVPGYNVQQHTLEECNALIVEPVMNS